MILWLAARNLVHRPLRTGLAGGGLALALFVLICLSAFGEGYRRSLSLELEHMGLQLMLVPLGCPYESAAQVIKGRALENSLPESALALVRQDPAVAVAAPLLMAASTRSREGRTDWWVGLDESALSLKPWWRARLGQSWFSGGPSVILGADAAELEMRQPGDKFHSPEGNLTLRVAGVLERSGTSDDSLFFIPLRTAQEMLGQSNRLTAIAIRLHDPALLSGAASRLQRVPGAQVVTMTEMMGTFLNLVGTVRTLLISIALVAITASILGVFNTLLAAILERTPELTVLRALGASRAQVFALVTVESLLLASGGCMVGILLAGTAGPLLESSLKHFVPLAPPGSMLALTPGIMVQALSVAWGIGALAGLYPAWQASRMQPALAVKWETG